MPFFIASFSNLLGVRIRQFQICEHKFVEPQKTRSLRCSSFDLYVSLGSFVSFAPVLETGVLDFLREELVSLVCFLIFFIARDIPL